MDTAGLQAAIAAQGFDGWLIADFRGSNPAFSDLTGLCSHLTRRVFCWLPAQGEPAIIGSRIDAHALAGSPYPVRYYLTYGEREALLAELLSSAKRVAVEYSEAGRNPYVARVDAGTVDLMRSLGVEIGSSANLLDLALTRWDEEQIAIQREAAVALDQVRAEAFERTFKVMDGEELNEWDVAAFIRERFQAAGLETEETPIVAVGPNSADPHYAPSPAQAAAIRPGDWILIDLWAKRPGNRSPFADSTWVGYIGSNVPAEMQEVFDVVAAGRDLAIARIIEAWDEGREVEGWEVDRAVRDLIAGRGYGDAFIHRTGHSLGRRMVHGDGANLDDFETHDERRLGVGSAVTVEPGVYLPGRFGVRLEVDVVITPTGPIVTTEIQRQIVTPGRVG